MKRNYCLWIAATALLGAVGCSATAPFGVTPGVQVPAGQAPGTASVTVGQSIGLAAFAFGGLSTGGVTWSAEAGTVTSGGVYTAPDTVGSFKVTATSTSDQAQKTTVTVNVRPALTLSPAALGMFTGESKTLGGASVPAGFSALSWKLVDGPVGGASVDAVSGAFTATAEGVYTVEATLVGATDVKKTLTVAALAPTTTPILSPGAASVTVGSQVQFSASILGAARRTPVGLYVSPHLESLSERVSVDDRPISGPALAAAANALLPWLRTTEGTDRFPTFFELLTAAAHVAFRAARVRSLVLEVGLGGRLDATNVCVPRATAITTIELEHVAILGDTLARIAGEKAGILKPRVPCVTAVPLGSEALEVIEAEAARVGAPIHVLGRDFFLEGATTGPGPSSGGGVSV